MIPLIVLVLAIIMGVIYGVVFNGAVFNVGVDFTGGYAITVKIGTKLDDPDERKQYEDTIIDIIEHPSEYSENVPELAEVKEGFTVRDIAAQNEGTDRSLRILFTASGYSDLQMVGTSDDDSNGIVDYLCTAIEQELRSAEDLYSIKATSEERTTATVSTELIVTAICGVLMSLALMLIYVAVRFELMSGVVALICLVHDMIMMVLFMCIFHIELASTFIAALITILGYSINNTIIIFDMIRDLNKRGTCGTPTEIANISVRDTLVRSINTTATTFITVAMIAIMSAIFSVWDLLTFCLPLMAGLIAGMFSSVLLAPTMWALIKTRQLKKAAAKKPAAEAVSAAPTPFKDSALENFFAGGDAEAVKAPADGEAQPSGEAGDAAGSADSAAGEAKPEEGAQEAESEVTSESATPSESAAAEEKPDDAASDDKE